MSPRVAGFQTKSRSTCPKRVSSCQQINCNWHPYGSTFSIGDSLKLDTTVSRRRWPLSIALLLKVRHASVGEAAKQLVLDERSQRSAHRTEDLVLLQKALGIIPKAFALLGTVVARPRGCQTLFISQAVLALVALYVADPLIRSFRLCFFS